MLQQGDIIKLNLSPTFGREQSGYRPAIVVSTPVLDKIAHNFIVICPITNTKRQYPLHVPLDDRTETKGYIMCDQVRTVDAEARQVTFVEELPGDILETVIDIVIGLFDS